MSVTITRSVKGSLTLNTPVMPAAGIFGFGDEYRALIQTDKLGAIITNPITLAPWNPAMGTRVIPLDAGTLVHTGLPNPGLGKALIKYRAMWSRMPVPVILHLILNDPDEARRAADRIEGEECIAGIELGLNDEFDVATAAAQVRALTNATEKPVIARLPFGATADFASAVIDAGAGAVVMCAPPRGTARDFSGRLVSGRIYGALVKPMVLRMVGQLARRLDAPVIGAGGIHTPGDARDYLEAGAVAVQVDTVVWRQPKMIELIARDLGGLVITQPAGALDDEWYPGMGETDRQRRISDAPTDESSGR